MTERTAAPPEMASWNLALRFGLEVAAIVGLGVAAWRLTPGPLRWAAMIGAPLVAAVVWGVFNVLDDPSRSGSAPVEVNGWTRLLIELGVLGMGAAAMAFAGWPEASFLFIVLVVWHYVASWRRIVWLVQH